VYASHKRPKMNQGRTKDEPKNSYLRNVRFVKNRYVLAQHKKCCNFAVDSTSPKGWVGQGYNVG
jgi:hypothetical protein